MDIGLLLWYIFVSSLKNRGLQRYAKIQIPIIYEKRRRRREKNFLAIVEIIV